MIAALDVDYRRTGALAACLVFDAWISGTPVDRHIAWIERVEPYEPGQFYRRELPCLLAVLQKISLPLEGLVIDGFVWLGDTSRPGLGAHLYEALGQAPPVVGVAKTAYRGAAPVREVHRGGSSKPLLVSSVGLPLDVAAEKVASMHGPHRLPTLLKAVDRLCRSAAR